MFADLLVLISIMCIYIYAFTGTKHKRARGIISSPVSSFMFVKPRLDFQACRAAASFIYIYLDSILGKNLLNRREINVYFGHLMKSAYIPMGSCHQH